MFENLVQKLPEQAQAGISYLQGIWDEGAFGMTYGDIIIATSILLFALIIRGIFARTVVRGISRAAAGTKTNLDDALVTTIAAPLKMVPIIVGVYAASQVIVLNDDLQGIVDKVLRSLVAFSIFWTLNRAVGGFSFLFTGLRSTLSPAIVDWITKSLQLVCVFVGAAAILEIWGIQVGPILAGLGIFGVAVALGAQDLFKNLISGILILVERRMERGEWIAVDGVVEGTVEKINFRSTLVRRFDKAPVYVPNSKFSDNAVVNYSRMTHRRIKWVIGVEYSTTTEQLRYIRDEIEAYLYTNEAYAKPPEATLFVHIDSFNDSSIDFLIYCFTKTTVWTEWLQHKEEFALKLIDIVEKAGTGFAFPSRTLYMQQQEPPEVIHPPTLSESVHKMRALKGASSAGVNAGAEDGGDG
ncbi:mechanosensitive ion channel family protein [Hirschia maritima]|uniref:mechanosensitive ion channel family protein n=1 Tax=Hirschia maritima TaxID=1121961 RepID=UPI0003747AAF|nr:mechanosensitive ion channel family protein [Hirschia maritima]